MSVEFIMTDSQRDGFAAYQGLQALCRYFCPALIRSEAGVEFQRVNANQPDATSIAKHDGVSIADSFNGAELLGCVLEAARYRREGCGRGEYDCLQKHEKKAPQWVPFL